MIEKCKSQTVSGKRVKNPCIYYERESQLRTLICIPRKLAFFYAFFRYFMQNRHKLRHFRQKIRLHMQNLRVGEVKLTFSALFFCQKSRYFFIFFTSTKNAKKAARTGFEQNLRIKLLFFVAAKTAQKCCLWWSFILKALILSHSFKSVYKII